MTVRNSRMILRCGQNDTENLRVTQGIIER
jgi:hypothetical protein